MTAAQRTGSSSASKKFAPAKSRLATSLNYDGDGRATTPDALDISVNGNNHLTT